MKKRFSIRHILSAGIILAFSLGMTARAEPPKAAPPGLEKATFAGGCFWCMEPPFDHLDGVMRAHGESDV